MSFIHANHAVAAATVLLQRGGLGADMAGAVARRLVQGQLLGRHTHGLAMLPTYLERLADGRIAREGRIETLSDQGGSFSWRVDRLPGAWVMDRMLAQAVTRAARHAVVTATVAGCSHIGALQAYLADLVSRELLGLLMVTDPGVASVAPPGGIDPVITSNPVALCIPTERAPLLIDQSTSMLSNGAVVAALAAGKALPGPWLLDNQGRATDDPAAVNTDPPGTLLPVGGLEFGYKGFGFGLMVEAFALALSGFGRDQARERGAQGVFLLIVDPGRFGDGKAAFLRAMSALVDQCEASRPIPGGAGVRLPGEAALRAQARQLRDGLDLSAELLSRLDACARRLGLDSFSAAAPVVE
ncbi:hypothetical protein CAL29_23975 [Bordetella genomosp. 10]|uniref:Lactate dehydrogenase n=1 Tax=Bordetella genomosp. 10 TaxID=1416804 RepID=A0A261S2J9_9BORD|nr:Ldh family oxidoreductase [Bordetella genomosp. 10]OZI31010.1 hypothetical protein CAL29_23975 [Bordetella genomosp. 10]